MSTEYQCSFNVELNLENRPDIYQYILESVDAYHNSGQVLTCPEGLLPDSRVSEMFYNCGYENKYNDPLETNTHDIKHVKIKYTLGNKNKDEDIEYLIIMLIPYVTKGFIILDDESYDWNDECNDVYKEFKIAELKTAISNLTNGREIIPLPEIQEFIDNELYNYVILNRSLEDCVVMYDVNE